MFLKRPLFTAITLSVFAHGIILFQVPALRFIPRQPKPLEVEIKYVESKKSENNVSAPKNSKPALRAIREPLMRLPSVVTAAPVKTAPSPFTDRQELPGKDRAANRQGGRIFTKPVLFKPDIGVSRKKITLAPPRENLNKINSPSYIGYFQLAREKVKRILYQRYTYTQEGEVYVSFIVGNDGIIKNVRINEEMSSKSPYLREIAIASVKEASPFPIFPKELEYPELSFNVVVSFEVE